MPEVYLDHHTAARPCLAAIEAMLPFLREKWGSAAAPHHKGQELAAPLHLATQSILDTVGAHAEDRFYFFASADEAISHLYLTHYLDSVRETGKNHILTTAAENPAFFAALRRLEELGCHGKMLPVNAQGQLTAELLRSQLKVRASLVSISWGCGLTGVIHPIADLAEVCRANDVRLHVDISHVLGKLYFKLADIPVDFVTFEGSVLYAPQGTAGLITRGQHPSRGAPTPVGSLVALARALEEGARQIDPMCLETARLRDKLEKGIQEGLPDAVVLFEQAERLPNCTAIAFPGVVSEALLFLLHRKGIYATLGGGRLQLLSDLLTTAGIEQSLAYSALSFSLSVETTEEEIAYATQTIVDSVRKLQLLSRGLV